MQRQYRNSTHAHTELRRTWKGSKKFWRQGKKSCDAEWKRDNSKIVHQRMRYWSKYCLKRFILRLVLKAWKEGLWQREKKRIPDLCSKEVEHMTTMLFSIEGGRAKSSIISRRVQRPRRIVDLVCKDAHRVHIESLIWGWSSDAIANSWTFVYFVPCLVSLFFKDILLSVFVPFIFEPCQIHDVSVFCVVLSQQTRRDPASCWMFLFLSQFVLVCFIMYCSVYSIRLETVVSLGLG